MTILADSVHGYVYLYACRDPCIYSPDAGKQYVNYSFKLLNNDSSGSHEYLDVYQLHCKYPDGRYECDDEMPMNPEDTWFTSDYYERHWKQNWHGDVIKVKVGNATNVDILGLQEFQFGYTDCGRCTESFMDGQTAFVANRVGPIRAIRSWVGANSGCILQREHIMYEQRDDQITYVRVHPINKAMSYMQYEV